MKHLSKIIALSLALLLTVMAAVPSLEATGYFTFAASEETAQSEEKTSADEKADPQGAEAGRSAKDASDAEEAVEAGESANKGAEKDSEASVAKADDTDKVKNSADKDKEDKTKNAESIEFKGKEFDVTIDSTPEAGLPADTKLKVGEIAAKDMEYKDYYKKALAAVRDDAAENSKDKDDARAVRFVRLYDFELTSGGEALEPDANVDVSIDYSKAVKKGKAEAAEDPDSVRIIHFTEDKNSGEIKADLLASKHTDAVIEDSALTEAKFEAESFSVYAVIYTVDFHYGDGEYDFSIAGESSIMLSEVLERLHIGDLTVNDVKAVKFSDPDLIKVEKEESQAQDGTGTLVDWKLTSLKAFDTDETLTLTLRDGSKIVIAVTDAAAVNVKEGESQWYTDEWITRMVQGQLTQPGIIRTPSNVEDLNADRKAGVDNSTTGKADSIWKKSAYDPSTNTVNIELDYYRQKYTSKLDFIFVIDETGTMNKDVTVDINGTTYKASRAFWAREIALKASKDIFTWNDNGSTTGFDNRTYYISWGGSKYLKSGFCTNYNAATQWYQNNSKIVGGGTNHNTTATHIQPVIEESIAAGRVPVVIYLSDFGSAMNSFKTASQQMLAQADVYPVLIYANDSKSQSRRAKLNAAEDHWYMMTDNDPTTLLPVFSNIVNQAISYVDPKTTVTDQLSTHLAGAADNGAQLTSEGASEPFYNGGQTAYDSSTGTATWTLNNGTDESGQTRRMSADTVYASTLSVPMKSDVVVSGSMPTNAGMQVKDSKGNVVNQITGTDGPILGKGVTFVACAMDENGNETATPVSEAVFDLKNNSTNETKRYTLTSDSRGVFEVPYSDFQFVPGETYTLTQSNTDSTLKLPDKNWILTVNNDYTISTAVDTGAEQTPEITAKNGAFCLWNENKTSIPSNTIPVVVKKVWSGDSTYTEDRTSVRFGIKGILQSGEKVDLTVYDGSNVLEASKIGEITSADAVAGNSSTWQKTVYVPAGSAGNNFTSYEIVETTVPTQYTESYDTSSVTTVNNVEVTTYSEGGWKQQDILIDGRALTNAQISSNNLIEKELTYYLSDNLTGAAVSDMLTYVEVEFEFNNTATGKRQRARIWLDYHVGTGNNDISTRAGQSRTWFFIPKAWDNGIAIKKLTLVRTKSNSYSYCIFDENGYQNYATTASITSANYLHQYIMKTDNGKSAVWLYEDVSATTTTETRDNVPVLQITNDYHPVYPLTIHSFFVDDSDDDYDTKDNIVSITYIVKNTEGAIVKTITLDKPNDPDDPDDGLDCGSQTVSLPEGTYTVTQSYYTLNDGRKVFAKSDGDFTAYEPYSGVDKEAVQSQLTEYAGEQTVTLSNSHQSAVVQFENRRLYHQVTVETVWEKQQDLQEETEYVEGGVTKRIKHEDIVIPYKVGTSVYRRSGTNSKANGWKEVVTNDPSYGVDGYPIICELDYNQLEDGSADPAALEVLYKYYTEVTQTPDNPTSMEDPIKFTVNIMRNRMPLKIEKTWANDETTADPANGNDKVVVNLINAETNAVVTPQYETSPDIELTRDGSWKTTVYVPGGVNYKVVETMVGETAVDSQPDDARFVPSYIYTDKDDGLGADVAVHIAAYDNEITFEDEDEKTTYIPQVDITNTHTSKADLTITKNVTGAYADMTREYTFTIDLPANSSGYTATKYSSADKTEVVESNISLSADTANFTLKNGQVLVISNVPLRKDIMVTETGTDLEGSSGTGESGKYKVTASVGGTEDTDYKMVANETGDSDQTIRFKMLKPVTVTYSNYLNGVVLSGLKIATGIVALALVIVLAMLYAVTFRRRKRA